MTAIKFLMKAMDVKVLNKLKENKNDYDEDISTEKLTESQNRELTDW